MGGTGKNLAARYGEYCRPLACGDDLQFASRLEFVVENKQQMELQPCDPVVSMTCEPPSPGRASTGFGAFRKTGSGKGLQLRSLGSLCDKWERQRSISGLGLDRLRSFSDESSGSRRRPRRRGEHDRAHMLHSVEASDDLDDGEVDGSIVAAGVTQFESYDYIGVRSRLRGRATARAGESDREQLLELAIKGLTPLVVGLCVGGLGHLSNSVGGALNSVKWDGVHALLNSPGWMLQLAAYPIFSLLSMVLMYRLQGGPGLEQGTLRSL